MSLQAVECPRVPPAVPHGGPYDSIIYTIRVPYAPHGVWEEQVLAAAPGTRRGSPALFYFNSFARPPVPASGFVTVSFVYAPNFYRCNKALVLLEEEFWPASPYHLFAALRHIGDIHQWLDWKPERGPGILATQHARTLFSPRKEGLSVWYPGKDAPGRAGITRFEENLGLLTLYAFVREPWKPE